jgi:L-fucose mutarotase/ribose pyranase (RbsD/FucU family)
MNTVRTLVKDLSGHSRVLRWAGNGVCVDANGIVILDAAYPAACKSTQMVRTMQGEVDGKSILVAVVTDLPTLTDAQAADVVAGSLKLDEVGVGKVETVEPAIEKTEAKTADKVVVPAQADRDNLMERIREAAAKMKAAEKIPERAIRPLSAIPDKPLDAVGDDLKLALVEGDMESHKPEALSISGESAKSIAEERKSTEIVGFDEIFGGKKAKESDGVFQTPEADLKTGPSKTMLNLDDTKPEKTPAFPKTTNKRNGPAKGAAKRG